MATSFTRCGLHGKPSNSYTLQTISSELQLKGQVHVPTILFYPGQLDGASGLRFMGVLAAEHNYRPKIF